MTRHKSHDGSQEEAHQHLLKLFEIDEAELHTYLQKLKCFWESLTPKELEYFQKHSRPEPTATILKTLRGKVTSDDVEKFFLDCPAMGGVNPIGCCHRWRDDDDHGGDDLANKTQ